MRRALNVRTKEVDATRSGSGFDSDLKGEHRLVVVKFGWSQHLVFTALDSKLDM